MDAHYNAFATDFARTRQNMHWPEFDLLKPLIQRSDKVLDLGCGTARLRSFLPDDILAKGHYFGMDVSRKLLDMARQNFPSDHFFIGDFAQKFIFGSDNFEIVTAIASFHHILSRREQIQFLMECRRVLKPGGTLFLTMWKIPKKHFWPNIKKLRFKNWVVPFGNEKYPRIYRRTNEKELRKLLKKCGFDVQMSELYGNRNYVVIARS